MCLSILTDNVSVPLSTKKAECGARQAPKSRDASFLTLEIKAAGPNSSVKDKL